MSFAIHIMHGDGTSSDSLFNVVELRLTLKINVVELSFTPETADRYVHLLFAISTFKVDAGPDTILAMQTSISDTLEASLAITFLNAQLSVNYEAARQRYELYQGTDLRLTQERSKSRRYRIRL